MYTFVIALALLNQLGFVPNTRNTRYHKASCTIAGYTVWCKDFCTAQHVANRVMCALYKRGLNPSYRVEDNKGNYQYNW